MFLLCPLDTATVGVAISEGFLLSVLLIIYSVILSLRIGKIGLERCVVNSPNCLDSEYYFVTCKKRLSVDAIAAAHVVGQAVAKEGGYCHLEDAHPL